MSRKVNTPDLFTKRRFSTALYIVRLYLIHCKVMRFVHLKLGALSAVAFVIASLGVLAYSPNVYAEPNNGASTTEPSEGGACDTVILPKSFCTGGGGVIDILKLVIRILTGLVGAAAIAAIVYAGILYSSAGDNSQQVSSAKDMIKNTVIGIIAFALMFLALNWLIPGGVIG